MQQMLQCLHDQHPGIVKMKATARSYVWWPTCGKAIEQIVRTCAMCQQHRHMPPAQKTSSWPEPSTPWARIYADLAGPFKNHNFLIVVDSFSGWMEIFRLSATTASEVIRHIRRLFATFGLPEMFVSDNGTQFVSEEFQEFLNRNSIKHCRSAPYSPKTNGLAERAVQTIKDSLHKNGTDNIELRLQRFLFKQHSTMHSGKGLTPAELMFGRPFRTHLTAMKTPDEEKPTPSVGTRTFKTGQPIYVSSIGLTPRWREGTVVKNLGFNKYRVQLSNGSMLIRHMDHIIRRDVPNLDKPVSANASFDFPLCGPASTEVSAPPLEMVPDPKFGEVAQPTLRRSTRVIVPPARYMNT